MTDRRAWAHPELLTREVVSLYERPLRVEGWDAALLAFCKAAAATSPSQVAAQFDAVRHLPVLLVTGGTLGQAVVLAHHAHRFCFGAQ